MARTAQHRILSGFGRTSTATDVLKGIDLTGRTAIVTGGYSGLGLATTEALARAGATVVVAAKRPEAARRQLADTPGTEVAVLDLADLASVRAFAEEFTGFGRPLDILVNNAGVLATSERRVRPGWEIHFAVNYLGHYALTNLLWPALTVAPGGARVVTVSSRGHKGYPVNFDDIMSARHWDMLSAYGQSKTANSLFAVHLDKLAAGHGVQSFAAAPGSTLTPLHREVPPDEQVERGWIDSDGIPSPRFVTPEQGAATFVWAATSPRLAGHGGVYCEACDIAEPTDLDSPGAGTTGVDACAIDPEVAARLWNLTAELTGIDVAGAAAA
ncbi:MAG TPA: oxidoreductase [Trebonia sp.]|jgi:NAD(P)-dependent dehydrogenase (short-subunit alcohol dehydrogenase family)